MDSGHPVVTGTGGTSPRRPDLPSVTIHTRSDEPYTQSPRKSHLNAVCCSLLGTSMEHRQLTHPVKISAQFSVSHRNSYPMRGSVVLSRLHCCCSVTKSCPALCNHMDCSTPGFPVHHQLPEFAHTRIHSVDDAIQPSHPLPPPSPPAFNLSQHQGLF